MRFLGGDKSSRDGKRSNDHPGASGGIDSHRVVDERGMEANEGDLGGATSSTSAGSSETRQWSAVKIAIQTGRSVTYNYGQAEPNPTQNVRFNRDLKTNLKGMFN